LCQVLRVTRDHQLCAYRPQCRELVGRHAVGDEHGGGDAELTSHVRHRPAMVACRDGDDAVRSLVGAQRQQRVGCAPDLERASRLSRLVGYPQRMAQLPGAVQRGAPGHAAYAGARQPDVADRGGWWHGHRNGMPSLGRRASMNLTSVDEMSVTTRNSPPTMVSGTK